MYNRGNYRKPVFGNEEADKSFEKTLFEVVERCGWKLYAYVIMKNHYHLAIETPEPNLVPGMQYLQGVFATRFNRYWRERGHVFQGRYQALLVGDGESLTGLLDYIYLNPVHARICDLDQLKEYERSSYAHYWKRRVREGLDREAVLYPLGFKNNLGGMRAYKNYLRSKEDNDPKVVAKLKNRYLRGWFIGSRDDKKEFLKWLLKKQPELELSGEGYRELNEQRHEELVKSELERQGKSEGDLEKSAKGAPWKVEIAKKLRKATLAKNGWISRRLRMGHSGNIPKLLKEKNA